MNITENIYLFIKNLNLVIEEEKADEALFRNIRNTF
jgi:hypothetical protein